MMPDACAHARLKAHATARAQKREPLFFAAARFSHTLLMLPFRRH
jgi:hypothetical protein